jgi:hypothetical protein
MAKNYLNTRVEQAPKKSFILNMLQKTVSSKITLLQFRDVYYSMYEEESKRSLNMAIKSQNHILRLLFDSSSYI